MAELSTHYGLLKIKLESETRMLLQDLIIDLFHKVASTTQMVYGCLMACEVANQANPQGDPIFLNLMKMMTHSSAREVRKTCVQHLRAPFSQVSLLLLGKRLRDKDDEIRR
jgi:hypothetical protein